MATIEFYKEFGNLGYLANYSNHGFEKNGIYYKTVEHYYQSEKFSDRSIKDKIINADTPKEASNIGRDRSNKRTDNFKKIKKQVMYDGILEKFRQNRDIAYKLIETKKNDIAEATIDEYYWGIGKDKSGENNIGKILVKVREEIKREIIESILDKCKDKKIYIVGHNYSDADSIFSSYILSKVLQHKGINAYFAILDSYGDYNDKEKAIINDFLQEKPVKISENNYFILVDHNNLDGLDIERVLGAFDHHIITGEVYDTIEMEYASTGLLLYDLFKDDYNFSEFERTLIYLTVLTDTDYLVSNRYSSFDEELVTELGIKLDVSNLQKKYFKITDFSLKIEDNLKKDYKEYKNDDKLIKRSIIMSYEKEKKLYYNDYLEYINSLNDNVLLIWSCYDIKKTYIYYLGKEKVLDYILTSTVLIMKMLKEDNIL